MPGVAKPLHLRLFMEGIEVPVVAAQVTASMNAPAAASIQIVPLDSAQDFCARTMVHLFLLDPSVEDTKSDLARYKLIFAGEAVAYQYQQTPQSRGIVLQCVDFSSYWDTAHAMAIEYTAGPNGNAFENYAAAVGATTTLFDDIVSQQPEVLVGWLRSTPKTQGLDTVSGLAGGIISMLEAMGGVNGHSRGVNDFFTMAELRCRIMSQIMAEEHDSTAANLLGNQVFDQWLRNGLQNIGQHVTFRDMMKLLYQYIYYETIPNPASMFVEAEGKRTQRLCAQIIRPDCWFAPPPVCNVIFPEQYSSLSYERNHLGEVTRMLIYKYNTLVSDASDQVGRILSTKTLAPNNLEFMKAAQRESNEAAYRSLLPHELHTGIVLRIETLPNTAATADFDPDSQVSWLKQISLFHFYKYRYAPRMAAVAGVLNVNVVCGFPAVIIRTPFIPDAVANASNPAEVLKDPGAYGAPSQLIGMVAYVSHNIDQQGGTTTLQLHHVRSHRGADDEFLKLAQEKTATDQLIKVVLDYDEIQKASAADRDRLLRFLAGVTPQVSPSSNRPGTATVTSTQSVSASEQTTSVDPASGKVTSTKSTSQKTLTSSTTKTASSAPPLTARETLYQKQVLTPKPAGFIKRGSPGVYDQGKVQAVVVENPALVDDVEVAAIYGQMFRRVTIYQKVSVPSGGKTPLEEIFMPRPWFSAKYANSRVGSDIYRPFFGCYSVVDSLTYQEKEAGSKEMASLDRSSTPTFSAAGGPGFLLTLAQKQAAKNGRSIERAIDHVAFFYGRVKTADRDVDGFIRQYTARPLATIEDMLGSETVRFTIDKNTAHAQKVEKTGRVGFHTAAVHPQLVNSGVPLAGLVDDLSRKLPRFGSNGKPSTIPTVLDVRKAKWDRVNTYRLDLMRSRGLRG